MIRLPRAPLAAALVFALAATGAEAGKRHILAPVPAPQVEIITVTSVPLAALKAAWTQYGPSGVLEARAVVDGDACPAMSIDLHRVDMKPRAIKDGNFLTECSATIPVGAKLAVLVFPDFRNGIPTRSEDVKADLVPLPVPVADPQRILIVGDAGCRSKGQIHQNCSKPEVWPFARVSAEAAKLKPDLVIYVGDFVSREQACPADVAVCQNQPYGDNWPAWDADFFTPAGPLLAAAPWVIARGNHEDCQREGLGFLRLLGPQAFDAKAGCIGHLPPFSVPFAGLNLVVSDDADAPEPDTVEASVPVYRGEIEALAKEKAPTWWILHRPIWGLVTGPLGVPIGGNKTLIAAMPDGGIPAPVALMLSGHIHTFEAINYEPKPHVPPQIVAGRAGDRLDPTPHDLHGAVFQGWSGVSVKDGISLDGFGFTLMTRQADGWRIDVYDWQGAIQAICQFHNNRLDCPQPKR